MNLRLESVLQWLDDIAGVVIDIVIRLFWIAVCGGVAVGLMAAAIWLAGGNMSMGTE